MTPIRRPSAATQRCSPTRKVYCPLYSLCLDEALRRDWESFSCEACPNQATEGRSDVRDFAQARSHSPFSEG